MGPETGTASPTEGADARDGEPDVSLGVLLLCGVLAAATVGQGAFYGPTRWLIAVGLGAAFVSTAFRPRTTSTALGLLPWASAALAVWALIRGATSDNLSSGFEQAALVAGLAATVMISRRWTATDHETVVTALLAIGLAVALSGWLGVAVRSERWAIEGATTWRAAATLTYPNSAAAVLVATLLLALARFGDRPTSTGHSATAAVLLAGLVATQSRGGAVALLVGLIVLAAVAGIRPVARSMFGPVAGAALATVFLVPGLDPADGSQPVLAVVGLAVGAALAAWLARSAPPLHIIAGVAVVAAAGVVAAFIALGRRLPTDRLSATSSDRASTTRAAVDVVADHPIVGVGPGNLDLVWRTDGKVFSTGLVHNEYLQVTAELGAVGAVLLLAVLVGVVDAIRRAAPPSPWIATGVVASLVALLLHSAFDFLWHISAVPLIGATIFSLYVSNAGPAIDGKS